MNIFCLKQGQDLKASAAHHLYPNLTWAPSRRFSGVVFGPLCFASLRNKPKLICLRNSAEILSQSPPPVYQDIITRHDWPVNKAIVDLPIKMKGNSKRTSENSLSPLRTQNKDIGVDVSQTLLTEVKLRLLRRLCFAWSLCLVHVVVA